MVRWAEDSDEFNGFKDDIKENGIKHPIQITVDGKVVDGWTRVLAARAWAMKEVPCVVVEPEEANEIVLRELLLRRNLTKGQRAYVAAPILGETFEQKRVRRLENLRKGQQSPMPTQLASGKTVQEWARFLGFSDVLMEQANWLHETFKKAPDLREEWEAKIFDPDKPFGLGACKAGIVQVIEAEKNGQKFNPNRSGQLELFMQTFADGVANRFRLWNEMAAGDKKEVKSAILKRAAAMTPEDCKAAAEALREIAKIYADAANEGGKE
jgi:hypothetical protein